MFVLCVSVCCRLYPTLALCDDLHVCAVCKCVSSSPVYSGRWSAPLQDASTAKSGAHQPGLVHTGGRSGQHRSWFHLQFCKSTAKIPTQSRRTAQEHPGTIRRCCCCSNNQPKREYDRGGGGSARIPLRWVGYCCGKIQRDKTQHTGEYFISCLT